MRGMGWCVIWVWLASVATAQNIEQGKLKSLDVAARRLVVTVGETDRTLTLTDTTRVLDATGETLAEKLADFKPGADMQFLAERRDGQEFARGLRLNRGNQPRPGAPSNSGRPVSPDHAHFKPLTELGKAMYQGYPGGLYPEGSNERPPAHEASGLKLAAEVRPRDASGAPSDDGKIVLLSIGMSNTSQLSGGFQNVLRQTTGLHPRLQFVDGAQGGMTAERIQDPDDNGGGTRYWTEVDARLQQAKVTRQQVQAVWIKQADAGPRQGFPGYAQKLEGELSKIVQVIAARFPNARLCYLSSRTYGGFATTGLNPEPVAYESGFAVKWLIEKQLQGAAELNYDPARGKVRAPWLSWGPYLWANGETRRADGFFYVKTDFVGDGTHHSPDGQRKGGEQLLKFFQNDTTTRRWFLAP